MGVNDISARPYSYNAFWIGKDGWALSKFHLVMMRFTTCFTYSRYAVRVRWHKIWPISTKCGWSRIFLCSTALVTMVIHSMDSGWSMLRMLGFSDQSTLFFFRENELSLSLFSLLGFPPLIFQFAVWLLGLWCLPWFWHKERKEKNPANS